MQRLGIEKIDYAFISHLDSDHYGGIIYLINEGLVNRLYKPKNISVKDDVFEKYLIENHTKYFYYSDTTFTIGGADLFFLNDTTVLNNLNFDSNNNSGIVKITYGKTSFLFTGDAEYEMEEYLLDNHSDLLKSDVLKVGHHGSKSSTSDEFLDAVDPKIGIISAGVMNKFKHPSKKKVINKLKKNKIEIRRTDWEGAIILASDGNSIKNIDWRNK
ncbi:MAG: MBL fold metallo-hydrolase [Ignavibacteriales bacterium]|nr:MBL fold metallo-hydrolase [Ignavibacteriales bacterium]